MDTLPSLPHGPLSTWLLQKTSCFLSCSLCVVPKEQVLTSPE